MLRNLAVIGFLEAFMLENIVLKLDEGETVFLTASLNSFIKKNIQYKMKVMYFINTRVCESIEI